MQSSYMGSTSCIICTSGFDSEEMSEEIANNLEAHGIRNLSENKRKGEKKNAVMGGRGPIIFLFVEHECPEMSHSLYMIEPPLDLSNYNLDSEGFMADSKYMSPILTFQEKNFLSYSASVNFGSKIYFLGGRHDHKRGPSSTYQRRLAYEVQVFDTDHPGQGMRSVAPMNGPKESPCVFVADGMIYALGAALQCGEKTLPGCKGTGFFERYDPSSDHWQVLPDPPLPFWQWVGAKFMDRVTVVGRRVFIGSFLYVIFDLDIQDWESLPPRELAVCFPYGSLFVQDSVSLYQLRGAGAWKPGTICDSKDSCDQPLQVVKRGPLTTPNQGDYDSISLLKDHCLVFGKEQVMATGIDLDENKFFTEFSYTPWRDLFHMGGRFFCYVVTAQLVDWVDFTHREPTSRGVWIKFFEEVPAHSDNCNDDKNSSISSSSSNNNNNNNNKTEFRPLASFCYKINTSFRHSARFIRCSVLGTVPDSWINAPLSKQKHRNKENEVFHTQMDQSLAMKTERQEYKAAEQRRPELENKEAGDYDLKKLLAVQKEENSRLAAELARKDELLKAYEALLAKTGSIVIH